MKYAEFYRKIDEDRPFIGDDGMEYIDYHGRRFFDTYNICARFLHKGDKVLSIGCGVSSLEKMMHTELGVELTVVDFPDVIELYRPMYEKYGIKYLAADLTKDELDLPKEHYDMLLQSEVIEHLPVPPAEQFLKFKPYIKVGGLFVVTTPNLGSILQISLLLSMRPIMPEPEQFFGPVCIENQGVHRREYLPVELKTGFSKAGFDTINVSFFYYTYPKSLALKILYGIGRIIPRFRPAMLVVGKRK